MRKNYQRKARKSNHKFEVVGGQELLVRVPLPMAEVWAELQAQVEELAGQAGLQILRAILENEVSRRVGPPHRPNPSAGCVRWGKQPGYVVFAGQKVPLERPRVRTREGQEVELESYRQLQQDGKLQRAVREGVVAGLSTRNLPENLMGDSRTSTFFRLRTGLRLVWAQVIVKGRLSHSASTSRSSRTHLWRRRAQPG